MTDERPPRRLFQEMTFAELLAAKAEIDGALRAAKDDLADLLPDASPVATAAVRLRIRKLIGASQAAQNEFSRRRHEEKEAAKAARPSKESAFVKAAVELLPPELFSRVLARSEEIAG